VSVLSADEVPPRQCTRQSSGWGVLVVRFAPLRSPLPRLTAPPWRLLSETPVTTIEEAFKTFTNREDVGVLLINQGIAGTIRHLLDGYTKPVPAILEIPSKDQPYDPSQDSILTRVKGLFGDT